MPDNTQAYARWTVFKRLFLRWTSEQVGKVTGRGKGLIHHQTVDSLTQRLPSTPNAELYRVLKSQFFWVNDVPTLHATEMEKLSSQITSFVVSFPCSVLGYVYRKECLNLTDS